MDKMMDELEKLLQEKYPGGYVLIGRDGTREISIKLTELGYWIQNILQVASEEVGVLAEEAKDE